ncbi:MAG: hypothetical protein ABI661_10135 [Gammaproteobacteria bacterium]
MGNLRLVSTRTATLLAGAIGLALVAVLVMVPGTIGLSSQWGGPAASFRVVDQDGGPISGAIVLMNWPLVRSGTSYPLRQIHVFEAESGTDGMVRVSAWGPIDAPLGTEVPFREPTLTIFKPGYVPFFDANDVARRVSLQRTDVPLKWDGKTWVLEKADTESKAYLSRIQLMASNLSFYSRDQQCLRAKYHLMIDAYNAELHRLLPRDDLGMSIAPNMDEGCVAGQSASEQ